MKIEISANCEVPFSYEGVALPIHQVQWESVNDEKNALQFFSRFDQIEPVWNYHEYNLNMRAALRTIQVYVPGCKRLRVVER
jgi:hypothetical protein